MIQRVQIVTVDPATRYVEFRLKDGVAVTTQIWEVPAFFTWPKQGEFWTAERTTNSWTLGHRMENSENDFPIENVAEGEAKVSAKRVIYTDDGSRVAVVVGSPAAGQSLRWDDAEHAWAPNSPEQGVRVAVVTSSTSKSIALGTAQPDANYGVLVTPSWNTSCWVTARTTTSFVVNFSAAPPSVTLDWLLIR